MDVRFVPPGPETGPIDWDIRANSIGEILTPFARYVRLDSPHCTHGNFPAFTRLPAELQIRILRFCSSATLFQLMQTSAVLRHEAEKLFWSDPDAWYLADGRWLLTGAFPGDTSYTPGFIKQVQQIEVSFHNMEEFMALNESEAEETSGEDYFHAQTSRIRRFWDTLQQRFPKVTRVVISEKRARKAGPIPVSGFQRALEGCPGDIDVCLSFVTLDDPDYYLAKRDRIRFNPVDENWDVIEFPWVRQAILIPPKLWHGPAAEYAQALCDYDTWLQSICGWYVLRIQAIERAFFGELSQVFRCPSPRCKAQFVDGREWAVHATYTGHYSDAEMPVIYKEDIARRKMKFQNHLTALIQKYKSPDSQDTEANKQAVFNQLEQDPDYAQSTSARESDIWSLYLQIRSGN